MACLEKKGEKQAKPLQWQRLIRVQHRFTFDSYPTKRCLDGEQHPTCWAAPSPAKNSWNFGGLGEHPSLGSRCSCWLGFWYLIQEESHSGAEMQVKNQQVKRVWEHFWLQCWISGLGWEGAAPHRLPGRREDSPAPLPPKELREAMKENAISLAVQQKVIIFLAFSQGKASPVCIIKAVGIVLTPI